MPVSRRPSAFAACVAGSLAMALLATSCGPADSTLQREASAREAAQLGVPDAVDLQLQVAAGGIALCSVPLQRPAADDLQVQLVDPPQWGTVEVGAAGAADFVYRRGDDDQATDRFTYRLVRRGGSQTSGLAVVQVTTAAAGVHGSLTYAFVPTARLGATPYLDYNAQYDRPIRGARLQLVGDDPAAEPIAQTLSDANGTYGFARRAVEGLRVQVVAEAFFPAVAVLDNTQGGAAYAMRSAPLRSDAATVDLQAPSGWEDGRYSAPRSAAAFAILDAAWGAGEAFAKARPGLQFPRLQIHWSEHNVPQDGEVRLGQIGTSHWNGKALYVLGHADVDTDEYDTSVLLHEWAHYFEATHSRSDSPGGPHSPGAALDMRLAFSEGLGNAVGSLLLAPTTYYADTTGAGQSQGFSFALLARPWRGTVPGYASERVVHSLLYDLFGQRDGDVAATSDCLGLGLGTFYDVLAGPHAAAPALTSLFSFVSGLKRQLPEAGPAVDRLVQQYGMERIDDPFGGGPLHRAVASPDGGAYSELTVEHPVEARLGAATAGPSSPGYRANRFVHLRGTGSRLTAWVRCPVAPSLYLYGPRRPQDGGVGDFGLLSATRPNRSAEAAQRVGPWQSSAGGDYTLNIVGGEPLTETMACVVTLQPS